MRACVPYDFIRGINSVVRKNEELNGVKLGIFLKSLYVFIVSFMYDTYSDARKIVQILQQFSTVFSDVVSK